jgi:hypothetical protein
MSAPNIDKKIAKFAELNKEHHIFSKELEEFLGEAYYASPASISIDLPGCFPGGLLSHSMTTAKYAVLINDLLPEGIKVDKSSLLKVVFLSQIGRTFMYTISTNEWQAKNRGIMYEYNESMRLSVGERSIMYATQHGVKLTDEEYQAILYSDKDDSDRQPRIFLNPISQLLKMGNQLAAMETIFKKDGK